MKCPSCEAENSEQARFCRECGKPMQAEAICPNCRHKNILPAWFCEQCGRSLSSASSTESTQVPFMPAKMISPEPSSFAGGRYTVKKLLGEGGRKRVYLVHDSVLDREVAFAQIKTEKLDEDARTRIRREAQAMGRLGDHPNIVTVYDFGEDEGKPFMVLPLLPGGDVQDLIEKAPDHRLPLDRAIGIAERFRAASLSLIRKASSTAI